MFTSVWQTIYNRKKRPKAFFLFMFYALDTLDTLDPFHILL